MGVCRVWYYGAPCVLDKGHKGPHRNAEQIELALLRVALAPQQQPGGHEDGRERG